MNTIAGGKKYMLPATVLLLWLRTVMKNGLEQICSPIFQMRIKMLTILIRKKMILDLLPGIT